MTSSGSELEPEFEAGPDGAPDTELHSGDARTPTDPVGVLALACGFIGIVAVGIVFAIVTAILGGMTGQRAREAGRSLDTAYLAMLLAAVDGAVWLVLHLLIDIPLAVG